MAASESPIRRSVATLSKQLCNLGVATMSLEEQSMALKRSEYPRGAVDTNVHMADEDLADKPSSLMSSGGRAITLDGSVCGASDAGSYSWAAGNH